jgi:hypothetical protein
MWPMGSLPDEHAGAERLGNYPASPWWVAAEVAPRAAVGERRLGYLRGVREFDFQTLCACVYVLDRRAGYELHPGIDRQAEQE